MSRSLRPRGFDELGLRRALSDRLLPVLVGAMAFLAALALGGTVAAAGLARHWQLGAASTLLVQVPRPDEPAEHGGDRAEAVMALLRNSAGVVRARALGQAELGELLRPWLGSVADQAPLPLPAVIEARLADPPPDLGALAARLRDAAPGTLADGGTDWGSRLTVLARSLQACAGITLLLVAGVAAAVVTVATHAGLAARRGAIEIVHGLGATDGYVARRFAWRATLLALLGGVGGTLLALPVLIGLAALAAPFTQPVAASGADWTLPAPLWTGLALLPAGAAALGWATAQTVVRRWLRRLP